MWLEKNCRKDGFELRTNIQSVDSDPFCSCLVPSPAKGQQQRGCGPSWLNLSKPASSLEFEVSFDCVLKLYSEPENKLLGPIQNLLEPVGRGSATRRHRAVPAAGRGSATRRHRAGVTTDLNPSERKLVGRPALRKQTTWVGGGVTTASATMK